MTQTENATESFKGKHQTYKERVQIEILRSLDKPMSGNKIAEKLGRARQTIHTEIKDGTIRQIRKQKQNGKDYEYEYYVYSVDAGRAAYEKALLNSMKQPKWVCSPKFMAYDDHQMKQSPDTVVGRAKKLGLFPYENTPSTTTLYNYIDQGFMETKNIDLHLKVRRKMSTLRSRKNKTLLSKLIEKRPDVVDSREEFGHWEIDTVVGLGSDKDHALLTLIERKTRYFAIIKIDGKVSNPVNQALSTLRDVVRTHFELLFKTITSDNGTEFSDLTDLFKDVMTSVYLTHPYFSWKRGTNENHNRMVGCFIPKQTRMENVFFITVQCIQNWMNTLPRKILECATPRECSKLDLTTASA